MEKPQSLQKHQMQNKSNTVDLSLKQYQRSKFWSNLTCVWSLLMSFRGAGIGGFSFIFASTTGIPGAGLVALTCLSDFCWLTDTNAWRSSEQNRKWMNNLINLI